MPDTFREHYAIGDRPEVRPSREQAMNAALALFGAHGRATRLAMDATADWYDPARAQMIRTLLMYAWASRNRPDLLPDYRTRALSALRSYRARKAIIDARDRAP